MLEVLDGVGAVGPAVSVDDAIGDTLDHAVNRVTEILRRRQHRREQDEQRECDLESILQSHSFNQDRTNLVVKTEDIVVCFNLLELEKLQQRLEEALHGEVTASSTSLFLLI